MKFIKQILFILCATFLFVSCGTLQKNEKQVSKEKPVVIANDSLAYEIIIIDIGFNYFLNAIAQPKGFYNQNYLEVRNRAWVTSWNIRAQNPIAYNQNIYENNIDYQPNIDYGYDVNYKLFNYFLFAQRKYKMSLGGGFRANRLN
ncbi:DUF6146 family protein [uncultured Polaribacter sp.]|uniref:DUF6146 family protein n=1 Tax=uncultured Polaribacter sp. TaxID=174711 RepID=UPI00262BAAD8|nr:DUF6146 family protein [uncultured Polaribacter sp.]